ncbi:hypothetical protein QUF49_01555 [Fictibacillus sp. b24]|uniref:hypothetical protein n=1 Tax=Fictibacillus sp. b24 TaxID=3055863 RepID=UPI0025A1DCD5|nr:hypothetical protein [Fictibacillus sp. b24]MDM5314656.1 hypothetical protein [Fictibacillus sp. b24]
MRDSYGTSGQVETPKGAKRQEAHRTPRGKRAAWSGKQPLSKAIIYAKTTKKKPVRRQVFSTLSLYYIRSGASTPTMFSAFSIVT